MRSLSLAVFFALLTCVGCSRGPGSQGTGAGGSSSNAGSGGQAGTGGQAGSAGGNGGQAGSGGRADGGGAPGRDGGVSDMRPNPDQGAAADGRPDTTPDARPDIPSRDAPQPPPDLDAGLRSDGGRDAGTDPGKPEAGRPDGAGGSPDTGPLPFLLGADISSLQEQLDQGARYKDTDGTEKSLLQILKGHGLNAIRLRTFVEPAAPYGYAPASGTCSKAQPYCDKAHVVEMAKQIKAAGMYFLLDFHYSDTWADPRKQIIPRAWRKAANLKDMAALLKAYTKDVLATLVAEGLRPDWVQVGNEITPGLCIHVPNADTDCWGNNATTNAVNGSDSNWDNTAVLLKAGIEGVRETDPRIKVVLHIESAGKLDTTRWWLSSAAARAVDFDILGLSCYTAFQDKPEVWKTTIETMAKEFPKLSFAIVEYNGDRAATYQMLRGLPNHRGVGSFVWEPTQGGEWGPAIFTYNNGVYQAQAAPFAEYETLSANLAMNVARMAGR